MSKPARFLILRALGTSDGTEAVSVSDAALRVTHRLPRHTEAASI